MKKLLPLFFLLFYLAAAGQENGEIKTIFDRFDGKTNGGYGCIGARYCKLDNSEAFISGIRIAWIINHRYAIGFGGYGFYNKAEIDNNLNANYRLEGGYGGLFFEPMLFPRFPIHLTMPVFVGMGGASYNRKRDNLTDNEELNIEDRDVFFLMEPGLELECNVFRFLRIGIGAYYRYTSNISLNYDNEQFGRIVNSEILHGFSYGIVFKIGKF